MGVQVSIAASCIDKGRLGYHSISLTNFAIGNTAEPSIAAGSKVEVGGALYEFTVNEAGTGWAGLSASAIAYIKLVPSGASISWIYTNTAPTYDTAKQGWYTGSDRVVGMLYKDAAGLYQFKNIIPPGQAALTFLAVIQSTVNPFLFNLPAATGTGLRVRVMDSSILATGLVQVTPNGTDIIGSAGNVSCFLQNVDESTFIYKFQFLDLVDARSGYWEVLGGQLCPDQAVDTDGQQYHLGKLHHLPLGNNTSRQIYSGVPPALSSWSAAQTGAGVYGTPAGAKALLLRVLIMIYATAAGQTYLQIAFSDNNSTAPTTESAHAKVSAFARAAAAAIVDLVEVEIIMPLNASGQFYFYNLATTNVTLASSTMIIYTMGYYMGD